MKRSYGDGPESTVRSNAAIALAMPSLVTPVPKTAPKRVRYPSIALSLATTWSRLSPISTGLWMGPSACSSSEVARPSQNWNFMYAESSTVPELRVPMRPPMPVSTLSWFAQAVSGAWHVAQLTVSSAESRGSKKSRRPSSTLSLVCGLSDGTVTGGSARLAGGTWLDCEASETTEASIAAGTIVKRQCFLIGPHSCR